MTAYNIMINEYQRKLIVRALVLLDALEDHELIKEPGQGTLGYSNALQELESLTSMLSEDTLTTNENGTLNGLCL